MAYGNRAWIDPSNIVNNIERVDLDHVPAEPSNGAGWHYMILGDYFCQIGTKWNGSTASPAFTYPNRLIVVDPASNTVVASNETTNTEVPPDELFMIVPNDGNDVTGLYWNGSRSAPQFADTPYA